MKRSRLTNAFQIDAICDQFESDWLSGQDVFLESYLPAEDASGLCLRELLQLEISLRKNERDDVTLSEYLFRFPLQIEILRDCITKDSIDDRQAGFPQFAGQLVSLVREQFRSDEEASSTQFIDERLLWHEFETNQPYSQMAWILTIRASLGAGIFRSSRKPNEQDAKAVADFYRQITLNFSEIRQAILFSGMSGGSLAEVAARHRRTQTTISATFRSFFELLRLSE